MLSNGYFPTSDGHQLYWQRHGTAGGEPVLFLHGGPGGRISRHHLDFFDEGHFEIILFDQRGCGRSIPRGDRASNSTWQCVEDIDALRQYFGFERVSVLGVSWGSWLAIQYQHRYPQRLLNTTLVSLFVPFAANHADYDARLSKALIAQDNGSPGANAQDLYQTLNHGDREQCRRAAKQWLLACLHLNGQSMRAEHLEKFVDDDAIDAIHLELHYHWHRYFFSAADEQLTLDANTLLIQGIRDDWGMASVRWLRQRTDVDCRLLQAGHNAFEPGVLKCVRGALLRDRKTEDT
ncbi:alpha/beta fold hydrolase [Pseudomonas sp. Eth.TT006]